MQGSDFQEKLRHTPIEITDLYDALSLVNSQLGMMDVLVNIESISQGTKNPVNIYRMFHRLNKLFAYKAKDKNITIRWKDDGQIPFTEAYQSLEFIPIILLDNAIKYSAADSTIWVDFHKTNSEIVVTISSKGKTIPEDERERIFEKYERGNDAKLGGVKTRQ